MKRFLVAIALASATIAGAQPLPPGGGQIQSVMYLPNQVLPLTVAPGYAVLVELSSDERIDNVVVGDSGAWQVTTTRQGNQFVVKPVTASVTTDLIVSTNSRRYVFLLKPAEGGDGGPYVLRFDYPEPIPMVTATTPALVRYRFHGASDLFPVDMSSDGGRTSIVWKGGTALSAVFALDENGHEALVNGRMVGQTYVIEGSAARYVFRRDKAKAIAIRENPSKARR